jgi:Zn-dependent peptidase ImmA (M78 family)
MGFYRGFKAHAERLALDTRQEMGISAHQRLDPQALAEHLSIKVMTLGALATCADIAEALGVLHGPEASSLSAFTVFAGSKRMIVHNEAHTTGRQASNITHEVSHGLLLHPAAPVLDLRGCRNWNGDHEDEANFLAGALLIPARAAWGIARKRMSLQDAADIYGCSVEMVRWRVNITGASRRLTG